MKLNEVINHRYPPDSAIPSRKKTQLILKRVRRLRDPGRSIRDVAHGKNRDYIPDPDPMDYLDGHEDNGPTFS